MGANGTESLENFFDDALLPAKHIIVPESQNTIALVMKPGIARRVGTIRAVPTTVDFDNQAKLKTGKIRNVWANRVLTTKAAAFQLTPP
jgi:hypothetical protein